MAATAADLRRRVDGWRRAERREQSLRAAAGAMAPGAALHAALELFDLLPVDFRKPDMTRVREIEMARRAWQVLRIRLTAR